VLREFAVQFDEWPEQQYLSRRHVCYAVRSPRRLQ
jgi:hypothetical protein